MAGAEPNRHERGVGRVAVLGLGLGLAMACRPTEPPPATAVPTETEESSASDPTDLSPLPEPVAPRSLEQRLDAMAVTAQDFVRFDLYTWTTPEQIEALRAGGPLLVAEAGDDPSPFNRLLRVMVDEQRPGHELAARFVRGPGLTKRRYAWPNAWATVLGKGPRRYGEALIRVQLMPDAIIARLDPTVDPPWSFFDAHGPVSVETFLDQPLRLGAVYHLRVDDRSIPYRELVLCNEAMVARWSVGTPEIAEHVAEARALVAELSAGPFATLPPSTLAWRAWPQWVDDGPAPTLLSRWHRALAFDNERYRPSIQNLAVLDAALADYDPTGPALVGGSDVQARR